MALNYDSAGGGSYTTLTTAIAAVAAVDTDILALSGSSETITATTTYAASSTYAPPEKPQRLIGVDDFSTPAPTPATKPKITIGGNYQLSYVGNWELEQVTFDYVSGTSNTGLQLGTTSGASTFLLRDIDVSINSTHATLRPIRLGPMAGNAANDTYRTELSNCNVLFPTVNAALGIGAGNHFIKNLGYIAGSTAPNNLFSSSGGSGLSNLYISDSDLSGLAAGGLLDGPSLGQNKIYCNNVKLNASTAFFSGTMAQHNEITAVNCMIGTAFIEYAYYSYSGSVLSDSTVYKNTSNFGTKSRKLTSNSTTGRGATLKTELLLPVSASDVKTPYVEILSNVTLTDDDCWLDVSVVETSGSAKGTTISTRPATLSTPTALTTSTDPWTNNPFSPGYFYRIELPSAVTITQDGWISAELNLAKASAIVYVGDYGG